jgi:hypothetical protein
MIMVITTTAKKANRYGAIECVIDLTALTSLNVPG